MRPDDRGGIDNLLVPRRRVGGGVWRDFAEESGLDADALHLEGLEEQARRGPVDADAGGAPRTRLVEVYAADVEYLTDAGIVIS